MSQHADEHWIKERLEQLRCHFTWQLIIEAKEMLDLESRILEEIEFLDTQYNVEIHNLLAYVQHLKSQNEAALENLQMAEELIRQKHGDQSDVKSLVTWGNYAWVYYHLGKVAEAQTYLDKVEKTCKKFESPSHYRIRCPEIDCAEGWAFLKCGGRNYEQAKVCFQKALEADPENPEFSTGYAITLYRLDGFTRETQPTELSLLPLRQAVRLNPEDVLIKVLLALKLQEVGQEEEGEQYIEEALTSTSSQTYVFRHAARFYRRKGSVDKALQFLKMALQRTPDSAFLHHQIGLCYRDLLIQTKEANNRQPRVQSRPHDNIIKSAIFHLEYAVKQKPTFDVAYVHLASMYIEASDYRKAEETYQKVLEIKPFEAVKKQKVHFQYARFLEFQRRYDDGAIRHYLEAIKIETESFAREKSIGSLEKLALRKCHRNPSDEESWGLLGFIHKMKGEINEALDCYEKAIGLATGFELSKRGRP
ncbi:interferon-induced protein with tetratricopeptide repeats 1 [Echinops telfairi]|uniref:Interferon-induced protein with tetratricopeptide repeats 1 n=1 Tax=Echinops telfairi TaxID=9371 RepID=A0ABM0IJH4_ECHTE|nr:interferon-induced protein with tetratricopeptide repeats 1 [Echinops telfairi]